MELAGTREDLIWRLGWAAPHWGGLARSWKGRTGVLKRERRLAVRLGPSGRRRRPWSRARGTEKSVLTHWLWPPSHWPAPHQAVSLWGGLPPPAGPSPRGAVAAGTASEHQLPLIRAARAPSWRKRATRVRKDSSVGWCLGAFPKPSLIAQWVKNLPER